MRSAAKRVALVTPTVPAESRRPTPPVPPLSHLRPGLPSLKGSPSTHNNNNNSPRLLPLVPTPTLPVGSPRKSASAGWIIGFASTAGAKDIVSRTAPPVRPRARRKLPATAQKNDRDQLGWGRPTAWSETRLLFSFFICSYVHSSFRGLYVFFFSASAIRS